MPQAQVQEELRQDPFAEDQPEEEYPEEPVGSLRKHEDGSYTWLYIMDMKQDRSILWIVLKILGACFGLIFAVLAFASWQSGFDWGMMGVVLLCFAVILVIGVFSYWLVGMMYQWEYYMEYRMDEEGIRFSQTGDQAEKTKMIAGLTALAGAAAHNAGTMAAGMAARNGTEAYSEFKSVKRLRMDRKHHVIHVTSPFLFNKVYVPDEFYDFVWDYIASRCPNARKIGE